MEHSNFVSESPRFCVVNINEETMSVFRCYCLTGSMIRAFQRHLNSVDIFAGSFGQYVLPKSPFQSIWSTHNPWALFIFPNNICCHYYFRCETLRIKLRFMKGTLMVKIGQLTNNWVCCFSLSKVRLFHQLSISTFHMKHNHLNHLVCPILRKGVSSQLEHTSRHIGGALKDSERADWWEVSSKILHLKNIISWIFFPAGLARLSIPSKVCFRKNIRTEVLQYRPGIVRLLQVFAALPDTLRPFFQGGKHNSPLLQTVDMKINGILRAGQYLEHAFRTFFWIQVWQNFRSQMPGKKHSYFISGVFSIEQMSGAPKGHKCWFLCLGNVVDSG